jgi:plastocyanin
MANRYVSFYEDSSHILHASPDPLYVNPGDQVIWTNGMSGEYRVTNFSPTLPALFSSGSIDLPGNNASAPATVQANPAPGTSVAYSYACVPVLPTAQALDPIIIVETPGGG